MNKHRKRFIAGVFDNEDRAFTLVEDMIEHDFPMDQVSVLHRAGGQGDDVLGIAYADEKERFRVWGTQGALWGALGGLLAGTAGLVLLPGVGPLLIAGPIVDAIAGAIAGAGLMTSGAAITHVTIALRRMGIPEEHIETLHQAIMDGKTVLILNSGNDDPEKWRQRLKWQGADPVVVI